MRTPKPRLTVRQQIEKNQSDITGMAKLMGKPAPVFSITYDPVVARKNALPKNPKQASEAQILKTIMAYLRVHPMVGFRMRVNSGVFVEDDRFIQANSARGCSDILGITKQGRFFAIEVKSAKGRLLPHQADFLANITKNGGLAGVCRDISDVDLLFSKID